MLDELRQAGKRQLEANCPSLLKNCEFLWQRVCEHAQASGSDFLSLAICYQRQGEYSAALGWLDRIPKQEADHESIYLTAWCLFKTHLLVEAKNCLLLDDRGRMRSWEDLEQEFSSTGTVSVAKQAVGLHLLGLITHAQNEDEQECVVYFDLAVRLDPFLFEAREKLAICKGRARQPLPPSTTSPNQLEVLERANWLLAGFQLDETIELLGAGDQTCTYSLALVARSYFEKAEYSECVTWYQRVRKLDGNFTLGVEYYSTALWHLKRPVDLAYLARDLATRWPHRPETWIVVGNCFSLEKEHELAIRFFKRALQLDERCTYAYTLAGHEYVANEDFDQAVVLYRNALRTDVMHYNAWWGLGTIFARQEKHSLAQLHFERALAIHPSSSVLCCYLGTVLAKMNQPDRALVLLDRAKQLDPNNPQARYQRARVLFREERWEEVLLELEFVLERVPKEATVHMFMGQVCSKLRLKDRAMIHFVSALDLDPKAASNVREAMNQMEEEEGEITLSQQDFDEEEEA
ncbi:hypothetical protein BASA81_003975 [Batrachochytrium salamandrivorans]|nr:hypothetical protein BASA81_003975 [Batrachochytrium salamandrivorans]